MRSLADSGGASGCAVLNCCSILTYYFRGLLMESGTSSFPRRALFFVLAACLFMVSGAAGQQPASGAPAEMPGAVPPGQALPQATVSASGATAKAPGTESADQSTMVKLGPG